MVCSMHVLERLCIHLLCSISTSSSSVNVLPCMSDDDVIKLFDSFCDACSGCAFKKASPVEACSISTSASHVRLQKYTTTGGQETNERFGESLVVFIISAYSCHLFLLKMKLLSHCPEWAFSFFLFGLSFEIEYSLFAKK